MYYGGLRPVMCQCVCESQHTDIVHVCTFFRSKQMSGYSVPVGELQRMMRQRVVCGSV